MYQRLIIVGNLGQDPEMRYTPDGTPVTSFSVATNKRWTTSAGQQGERTVWFRVTAWRRLAETCSQFLSKGRQVLVEGELQEPRAWQGRDGEWRASLEVTALNVKFLGGRGDMVAPPEDADMERMSRSGAGEGGVNDIDMVDEDEIPF